MVEEFQEQQRLFNNNLKTLNRNLYNLNTNIRKQTVAHARSKAGAMNMGDINGPGASKDIGSMAAYNINGSINGFNKTAMKLDSTTKALEKSASEFTTSASDLTESIDNLTDVTEKSNSNLKEFAAQVGKWTTMIAVPAVGYAAYRGIKGAGKLGMKTAALPFKGVGKASGLATGFSQEVLGDTGFTDTLKKYIGASLSIGTLGMVGGMTTHAAAGKGKEAVGQAIGTTSEGIGKLVNFFVGTGKKVGKGVYSTGKSLFNVGPSEEFKNEFESVSTNIGTTNEKLQSIQDGSTSLSISPSEEFKDMMVETGPSSKQYKKDMSDSIADALIGKGKRNIFVNTLGNFFGKNVALAYALPIYGAGYRAELPTPGKYGFLGAMLKTLGLMYVHSRFASQEANDLLMEQSKLLQIGFEIPGTLYKPRPRSLSAWLGQSISESLSKSMGGEKGTPFAYMKDFITGKATNLFDSMGKSVSSALGFDDKGKPKKGEDKGLVGVFKKTIPGYEEWRKKKSKELQDAELGKSPTALKQVDILVEIRDILAGLTGAKVKSLKKSKIKIPKLQEAIEEPVIVEKPGLSWLDPGEAVGRVAAFGKRVREATSGAMGTIAKRISEAKTAASPYYKEAGKRISEMKGSIAGKTDAMIEGGGKLGFIGKIIKGIMNFFSGGIINKITNFFTILKDDIVKLPSKIIELLKNLWTEHIKPIFVGKEGDTEGGGILGAIKDLKKTYKEEGLGAAFTKGKKGIFDSLWEFIDKLPERIRNLQEQTTSSITDIFSKKVGEQAKSMIDIAKKIWDEMMPPVLKRAVSSSWDTFWDVLGKGAAGAGELIKAAANIGQTLTEFGNNVLSPMTDVWSKEMKVANEIVEGKDKTFIEKIIATIGAIPESMKKSWEDLGGTISKITDTLTKLLDPLFNLLSVTSIEAIESMVKWETMTEWKNVRKEGIKKLFPKTFAEIINITMNRIWDFGMIGLEIFAKVFSAPGVAKEAFSKKIEEEAGSGTSRFGQFIKGGIEFVKILFMELTKPVKTFIKKSIKSIVFVYDKLNELTEGGEKSKFSNLINNLWDNIVEFKDKMGTLVEYISNSLKTLGEFISPTGVPEKKMAKGGLIYAAKGVVVGEAGAEAVIPLDHPSAIEKISTIFKAAIFGGKERSLADIIVSKLDKIIGLLSHGGPEAREGILSRILTGIVTMPAKIVGGIFRGFMEGTAKGMGKMFGGFFALVPRVLEQISNAVTFGVDVMHTGFKALRGAIDTGVSVLKGAVEVGFKGMKMALDGVRFAITKTFEVIMWPFRKMWGFITKPFKAIGEKARGLMAPITKPIKTIKKAIERKIWGEDIIGIGPDGKPVYARWPKKIRTSLDNIKDILYDMTMDQQVIGLKVIGLLSKINSKTIVDPELADKMEPMEPLPTFPRKKRRSKAGKELNLRKDKKTKKPSFLESIFEKAKDWFKNSSFGKWFSGSALPSMISLIGPALGVLGAGAIGVAIGSMLNKYVVKPMLDRIFGKQEAEREAASSELVKSQKTRFAALDVYRQTGKGKEQAMASAFTAKATKGFIGASYASKGRQAEILGDMHVEYGGELSSGQQRKLGIVRDAQLKYMSDNASRYMPYGPEQVAIMREKWQNRWNGGFRGKRPFIETWAEYGAKREEAFLKYLEDKGTKLSLRNIEKQAFKGVKGLPTTPIESFARGGVITKPTLALMGEGGPEAIIPLRESQTGKLAPMDKIAENNVMLDLFRQRAGGKEVANANRKLGEKLDKLSRITYANSSVLNTFITTNNNTSVNSMNTQQGATIDSDTERLLGGKL